jgi:hypothetical protein
MNQVQGLNVVMEKNTMLEVLLFPSVHEFISGIAKVKRTLFNYIHTMYVSAGNKA